MVDWNDPYVEYLGARALELEACVLFGVYLWEVLTTFQFEWNRFTGKRPFKWTLVPYLLARYTMLLNLIVGMRVINMLTETNCAAWNRITFTLAHVTVIFGSFLLLLRVLALSGFDWKIAVPLGAFYLASCGTLIHGITVGHAQYIPILFLCGSTNTVGGRLNNYVSFAFDVVCLFTMMGLLISKKGGNLWKYLLSQGLMYFVVTVVAYTLPMVFLALNLNDAMNEIPQAFALVTMTLCATRMYRGLSDFGLGGEGVNLPHPSHHSSSLSRTRPPQQFSVNVTVDEQMMHDHSRTHVDQNGYAMDKVKRPMGNHSREVFGQP